MILRMIFLGMISLLLGCSAERSEFANPHSYGGEVSQDHSTRISTILARPAEFEGKTVVVEGVTGSVCENRGCWMYIEDGDARMRVTFKDYSFFVPIGSEGKRVRAEGIVSSSVVSKETLQHWAEEEEGGDPAAVTEDMTVVMLEASGVVMENGEDLSPEQQAMMTGG